MSKRVSNKKGRSRTSPARSTKGAARHRQKIQLKKDRLAAARRRNKMLEEVRRRYGEI